MKKFFIISLLLLLTLASILVLSNRKEYTKYRSLKEHDAKMHELLARAVFPYYRAFLVLPQNINELISFSEREGYDEIGILDYVYDKTHIDLNMDSIYIFVNIDKSDSILDNPVNIEQSTFWDYFLYKKDIVLFKGNKLLYCELEIERPKYRKDEIFMVDSVMFQSFHEQLSFLIEKQASKDLQPPYSKRRKLLVEADLFQDTIVCRNIITCDEFCKTDKVKSMVIEVLSKYKLEKNTYDKAIIPIYILEEAIN